jgi:hypothetical protein
MAGEGILYLHTKLNTFHTGILVKNAEFEGGAKIGEPGLMVIWWQGEVYTGFWWGNLRKTDNLEDPGI